MDNRKVEIDGFWQVVDIIRERFPHLKMEVNDKHEHVEALAEIAAQPGLEFEVSISLQKRDELHLNAGDHFWVEWFPCGDQEVFDKFVQSVTGVLSGEYRIVESYVLGRAVHAQLQRPVDGGWEGVTGWGNLGCLAPLPRVRQIRQNLRQPN